MYSHFIVAEHGAAGGLGQGSWLEGGASMVAGCDRVWQCCCNCWWWWVSDITHHTL